MCTLKVLEFLVANGASCILSVKTFLKDWSVNLLNFGVNTDTISSTKC
jgi:hypothetical protein